MQNLYSSIIVKLNKLSSWQVLVILTFIGLVTFYSGINTPFQGDDLNQIVMNIPVHSIRNIRLYFEGSTFYSGQGLAPLGGDYYRPLMTTVYSLVYTFMGNRSLYFHIIQMALFIGSCFVFYLFLRYSFKPVLSLLLSLLLLVNPMNSEAAYAIPVLQDTLFFFLGILGLYLLVRFKSYRMLIPVLICFLLSLFAKETGILFIVVACVYLFWWDRKRLLWLSSGLIPCVSIYLLLRSNAIGLLGSNPESAPIDKLGLFERLMTAPAIVLFYLNKFVFPWKLATDYYWYYPKFSIQHVLLPLVIDLIVLGLAIYVGLIIKRKLTPEMFYTYIFFGVWFAIGILFILQIYPLDGTVSEPWFYFPMAGMLGMIGVSVSIFPLKTSYRIIFPIICMYIIVFASLTAIRGTDYSSPYNLYLHDTKASKEDYVANFQVASSLIEKGEYQQAKQYDLKSIHLFPLFANYTILAVTDMDLGQDTQAIGAFEMCIRYNPSDAALYEDVAKLGWSGGDYIANKAFDISALQKFPHDSNLWFDLAILDDKQGDNKDAVVAIKEAAAYGNVPSVLYTYIIQNKSFVATAVQQNRLIKVYIP
jgi:hypothetical protein